MAEANPKQDFSKQISETRKSIKDRFKKSHEALVARENILLARVDSIEHEYNQKIQLQNELNESLSEAKSYNPEKLKAYQLTKIRESIITHIDNQLIELTADTDTNIEFVWDNQFETEIEQLGSIKLNDQMNISPTRTFSPQVKPVVPDYRTKQLPTAYRCKKSSDKKSPGELNIPSCMSIHYKSGNIYIAEQSNHRVQVFSYNGDYLFMFSEKMSNPIGICVFQNTVFVTQLIGDCVNMYELEGKLMKSVGSSGNGEAQFNLPYGIDVSDRNHNIYVCDYSNNRVQILTEELKYHSVLGIGLFTNPLDIKVTRDRVLVLDESDPCMFIFNSEHLLINRIISRGSGKQTNGPISFDIDRDYNIMMSDFNNHCVYVFNKEGKQIHKFGKQGQGIGEFYYPYGIVLDNIGRIIVVCWKDKNCLQFF